MSINKVILVGNVGQEPEIRSTQDGREIASFSVATSESWKDKQSGEAQERTEWHRVVFMGKLAEIAGEHLNKGSQVYVEGSLRTRKWTDQAGIEKYSTEIRADQMQMLGSREGMGGNRAEGSDGGERQSYSRPAAAAPAQRPAAAAPSKAASGFDDMDDDIPF